MGYKTVDPFRSTSFYFSLLVVATPPDDSFWKESPFHIAFVLDSALNDFKMIIILSKQISRHRMTEN
jgi:hypothetical protein